ncbi:MAG: hypothetical protein V4615_05800 [Bacteroidota bacterium]
MGYRFSDVATIDTEDCIHWKFKECSVQYLGNNPLISDTSGQYVTFNKLAFIEAEKNTNWDVSERILLSPTSAMRLTHVAGSGKPITSQPQIFLLKIKQPETNTDILKESPGHARTHMDHLIFNDYDTVMKYVHYPKGMSECSVWQYCNTRFELLHDFAWA